jgi:hypothetical protein
MYFRRSRFFSVEADARDLLKSRTQMNLRAGMSRTVRP